MWHLRGRDNKIKQWSEYGNFRGFNFFTEMGPFRTVAEAVRTRNHAGFEALPRPCRLC